MKTKLALIMSLFAMAGMQYAFAADLSIETDKDSYKKGDMVELGGSTDAGTRVAIEVKDSEGNTIMLRTVTADPDGNYELKFKMPSTASDGPLEVIANANVGGETLTESVKPTLSESSAPTTSGSPQDANKSGGGCLIATAAFGSELEPNIQLLREIRDNAVMSTGSGATFMAAFNQFYYTFSPTVADWERQNELFRQAVKLTVTPMISTLSILQFADIQSEEQMLSYGIGIILLNGGIYFGIPLGLLVTIRRLGKDNLK
jgi:hypothetical protein